MRAEEYRLAGIDARWLEPSKARNAYRFALGVCDQTRLGLSERCVRNISRLEISSYSVAKAWLNERFPSIGTVQIVYSDTEVAVVEAQTFLARWQEIFLPGRDDAVVFHNLSEATLFYCHEEELEVGTRESSSLQAP